MSCYMVSHAHINALLHFAEREGLCPYFRRDAAYTYPLTEVGQILLRENARSVCARYSGDNMDDYAGEIYTYEYKASRRRFTPLEILKACACYDYQACETDDYWETEAAKIIHRIWGSAINALPGYDNADGWGVEEEAEERSLAA